MKNIIKNELKGWKLWEVSWLVVACAIIAGLSIYWGETAVGIISATTGVACVVCTGKGKLSAYLFGLVNCALYAYIAYQNKYVWEVALNTIYYIPMQFYGFYVWSRHMDANTNEVVKKNMTTHGRGLLGLCVGVGTIIMGIISRALGGNLPYIDAMSTISSIFAMIVSIKQYVEQWWLWVWVDIITVAMYAYAFVNNGYNGFSTLLMWSVYLINAVIMLVKWQKEATARKRNAGCSLAS